MKQNSLTESAGARTQHTPGPWSHEWSDESVGYQINGPERDGGWREIIAQTVSGNAIANARLIAAAPELLATLQNLIGKIEEMSGCMEVNYQEGHEECYPEFDAARAAIAKAEGSAQ